MNNDWIKNLKIGDEVIIHYGGIRHGVLPKISNVEKINKVTVSVNGILYNIKDGFERGRDHWSYRYITECTIEKKADLAVRYERADILTEIAQTKWSEMPIEKLREVFAIIRI